MKKIVGILAAAAVATSAFAIDFSAGAKAGIKFDNQGYYYERSGEQIGTDNILSFSANTEVAGANIDLRAKDNADNGGKNVFVDGYKVWIKPVSVLKISSGSGADFSIFGDGIGKGDGKIGIVNDGQGAMAELTPIDGLWIGARVSAPNAANKFCDDVADQLKWAVGASYTIDGVAKFGAEFVREGNNDGTTATPEAKWNGFTVGAQLKAVENLDLIVDFAGVFYNDKGYAVAADTNRNGGFASTGDSLFKIGAFVTYKADALTLQLSDRVLLRSYKDKVANWDAANSDFGNILCAKVAYSVNAFTPYVSFGWMLNTNPADDSFKGRVDSVTNSCYASSLKGNREEITVGCDVKVGAAVVNAEFTFNEYDTNTDGTNTSTNSWNLPISMKLSF